MSAVEFDPFKFDKLAKYKTKQYKNIQFVRYHIYDKDDFNIYEYFNIFDELMNSNPNKKILIHCVAGVSRSASLVISYMIKYYNNLKFKRIMNIAKKRRSCIWPNDGFYIQLKEYYDKNRA